MKFRVRFGVPEVKNLWDELNEKWTAGTLGTDEERFFKRWVKAIGYLERDPRHPGLESHDIDALTRRYGEKVWQSYLQNRTPAAERMFWVYGPERGEITIIGIEQHPESKKRGGYSRVRLSELPSE